MNYLPQVTVISQARMSSSRLPGKVLKMVEGRSLLEYHRVRIGQSRLANQIVIATTTEGQDQEIVNLCLGMNWLVFRGSLSNVLERYVQCVEEFGGDVIVRVTSDCPLLDPQILDRCIAKFFQSNCDYLSTSRFFPLGMSVEVFSRTALFKAYKLAAKDFEKEHVTPFIHTRPDQFKLEFLEPEKGESSKGRYTVDELKDLEFMKRLIPLIINEKLEFSLKEINEILNARPSLMDINQSVRQKKFTESN